MHSKSAQDHLVSDVLWVLKSFGSFNILALLSDPTETIISAGDPAIKSLPSAQYRTVHTWNVKMLWLFSFKLKVTHEKRHTSLPSELRRVKKVNNHLLVFFSWIL